MLSSGTWEEGGGWLPDGYSMGVDLLGWTCLVDVTDSVWMSGMVTGVTLALDVLSKQFFGTWVTGGEGLWKPVITWWEHCGIRCDLLDLFPLNTFCSHFKCNLNMCLRCIHSPAVQMFPQMFPKCSWPAPTMISQWNHYVVCLLEM